MPVLNALSSLWHPTQVLADLLTLTEHAHLFDASLRSRASSTKQKQLEELRPLTLAYVGDCTNVLNDWARPKTPSTVRQRRCGTGWSSSHATSASW